MSRGGLKKSHSASKSAQFPPGQLWYHKCKPQRLKHTLLKVSASLYQHTFCPGLGHRAPSKGRVRETCCRLQATGTGYSHSMWKYIHAQSDRFGGVPTSVRGQGSIRVGFALIFIAARMHLSLIAPLSRPFSVYGMPAAHPAFRICWPVCFRPMFCPAKSIFWSKSGHHPL
jgi:hypothetical protein